MSNSKRKPRDWQFMSWLDRKQSNKKSRQQAAKEVADLIAQDVRETLAQYSQIAHNTDSDALPTLIK